MRGPWETVTSAYPIVKCLAVGLCVCVGLVMQSRQTVCDLMDCSLTSSSVHGILQLSILQPFPSPGEISDPGIKAGSPALQADSLHLRHQGSLHWA